MFQYYQHLYSYIYNFLLRKLIFASRVTLLHSYWCIKGLSRQVQDMRKRKTTYANKT